MMRVLKTFILIAALGLLLVLGWAFIISGFDLMLCGGSNCGLGGMFGGTVMAIIGISMVAFFVKIMLDPDLRIRGEKA